MKKLYMFLNGFISAQLGFCLGRVLAKYLSSASVILIAITVLIATIAYLVVGYIIKKYKQKQTNNITRE